MDTFNIVVGCASIASFFVSLIALFKVSGIEKRYNGQQVVTGHRNVVAGGDANVGRS